MGRGGRSRPKNPRKGPGHNEANRQNRESRSTEKMLDHGQEQRVRYYWENILSEAGMEDENARYLIQSTWTKGFRGSSRDARIYLKEKMEEGLITEEVRAAMVKVIDRYSKYR